MDKPLSTAEMLAALGWTLKDDGAYDEVGHCRIWKRAVSSGPLWILGNELDIAYNRTKHENLDAAVLAAYNARFPVAKHPDEDTCQTSQADLTVVLYRRVIQSYGQDRQVLKALEELAECSAAIARFFARESGDRVAEDTFRAQLIGELADAEITREQVLLMAGISSAELAAAKAWKLARLEGLVSAREGKRTDSGTPPK